MKNIIVIGLLIFFVYSGINGINLMNEQSNDELSQEIISSINSAAPYMVDNEIRLDGALLEKEQVIVNYTLVNTTKDEINIREFRNFINSDAKTKLCMDKKLKKVVNRGIKFVLSYKDKFKRSVIRVNLNKQLCHT